MTVAIDWRAEASRLTFRDRAFIDGKFVDAASGERFDCISPVDGAVLARVAACNAEDVDRAVKSARAAFEDGRWADQAPKARKRVLVRLAELIQKHANELALLETLDMGKPITHARNGDVRAVAECIRWYGEAIDKLYDEIAPTPKTALALITREPLGVVGAVVPWNFPLLMAAWKFAPALAAGNSVVLKPAEQSPLSALRVAELAAEAGVPPGVFNIVPGFGETAGQALGRHMDVDALAFTGSTEVGKLFLKYSGRIQHENRKPGMRGQDPEHRLRRYARSGCRRRKAPPTASSTIPARSAMLPRGFWSRTKSTTPFFPRSRRLRRLISPAIR